ncbi:MAG: DNA polymerase III subunit delta, partial [Betaproteobacteria bacterium]
MQIKLDALLAHLARGALKPVYTVSGDEPLLAIEAADAIRAAARQAGYSEREVVHADARSDWSQLLGAAAGLSLFASKRVLDIRLPSGKPGKMGAEALAALAAGAGDDLLLIALPKLDRKAREAAWPTALDRAGVWVDVPKVERDALPAWIAARLARQQQQAPREALEFIADRVEGNLLAAHQEIQKLALLHPAGTLTLEQVTDSVLNVARYEVFGLPL